MKRTGIYKASNVTFDPNTMTAQSYAWWDFVKVINGKLVFNDYNYSPTTNRHQRKVRALLRELNVIPNMTIEAPDGLQHDLTSSIQYYRNKIQKIIDDMIKPRARKAKNAERAELAERYKEKIRQIEELIA